MSVPLHPSLQQLRNMKEIARQLGAPNMGPLDPTNGDKIYGSNVPKTVLSQDDITDHSNREEGQMNIIEQLLKRIEALEG